MRNLHLAGIEKDKMAVESEVQKRSDFAKSLKVAVDSRVVKNQKEHAEKAAFDALSLKITNEFRLEQEGSHDKKEKAAEKFRVGLGNQIKEKIDNRSKQEVVSQELEVTNNQFNDMKYSLGERRKDIIKQQAMYSIFIFN